MIVYLLVVAFQVFCIVDVIRRGRSTIWIMALVFLPLASGIAYFIVEILPGLQGNRHVRTARQKISDKLDPEKELRTAQQALDMADTIANRIRVADALSALGRHAQALPLYQQAAGPRPDFRTGEKLARSLYLNDRAPEALANIEALPKVLGQPTTIASPCSRRGYSKTLIATKKRSRSTRTFSSACPATKRDAAMPRYCSRLAAKGRRDVFSKTSSTA